MSGRDWKERLKGVFRLKRRVGARAGVYGESGPMPGLSSPNLTGSAGMGHPGASTYSVPPLPATSVSDLHAERLSAMRSYNKARDNLVGAVEASKPSKVDSLRKNFDREYENLSRHADRWAAAVAGMPVGDRRTQEQEAVEQFRVKLKQENSVQGVWRRETLAAAAPGATEPQTAPYSTRHSTSTGESVEFNRSRGGSSDSERGRSSTPTSQRRADSPTRSVTPAAGPSEIREKTRSRRRP
jgi:hypothetical protein